MCTVIPITICDWIHVLFYRDKATIGMRIKWFLLFAVKDFICYRICNMRIGSRIADVFHKHKTSKQKKRTRAKISHKMSISTVSFENKNQKWINEEKKILFVPSQFTFTSSNHEYLYFQSAINFMMMIQCFKNEQEEKTEKKKHTQNNIALKLNSLIQQRLNWIRKSYVIFINCRIFYVLHCKSQGK